MVRVGPRFTFKYVIKIPINYVIILSSIRGCQLLLVEQPHLPIPFLPIPSPRTRSSSVKITVPERAPRYRNLPDLQSVPGLKYRRLITSSGSVTPRQHLLRPYSHLHFSVHATLPSDLLLYLICFTPAAILSSGHC